MSTKQLRRRHAARGFCDKRFVAKGPDTVDRLAFYMEMYKVDSSTDSESDTSPRWSDASSKGCANSGPETTANQKMPTLIQKPAGRHNLLCLDPYDGSSEDSSSSANGRKRLRQGSYRLRARGRRAALNPKDTRRGETRDILHEPHQGDVQMRSSSDSEMRTSNPKALSPCRALKGFTAESEDSGANTNSPLHSDASLSCTDVTACQLTDGSTKKTHSGPSSPRSPDRPSLPVSFFKRKLIYSWGDIEEYRKRKRQCVTKMEEDYVCSEGKA